MKYANLTISTVTTLRTAMFTSVLSAWLPNQAPTWGTVFTWIMDVIFLTSYLFDGTITWVWGWVIAGFVLTAIAFGPVSRTAIGRRISSWFQDSGMGDRALLIIVSLAAIYAMGVVFDVSAVPAINFGSGVLLWFVVFIPIQALYYGEISGWSPDAL